MPNFCTFFLYYDAEMSEKEYLHCVGHVFRVSKHILFYFMLPLLIIGSEKKKLGGDT